MSRGAYRGSVNEQERFIELEKHRTHGKVLRAISFETALKDLVKISGLDENPLLFEFYHKVFTEILSKPILEEQKLKEFTALMGLCMGSEFYNLSLPIPKAILKNHAGLFIYQAPNTYSLVDIHPWDQKSILVSRWSDRFEGYFNDLDRIEHRKSFKTERESSEDIEPDLEWKLRYDLAGEFVKGFLVKRLKELFNEPSEPAKVTERNRELRLLIMEVFRYPTALKNYIYRDYDSLIKKDLKAKGEFSKMCLQVLTKVAYGEGFDPEKFRREIIEYYWTQLDGLLQDEKQKKIFETIKLEVNDLTEE